ncbi:hypothetical protein DFH08DRAFT_960607 [Mycena albidolilacea]|uniref:Uncharacterized protein n=1 Tax=Mycena albidolilacea TaxID=1033008 RepID=A0AAD7ESM9_9AGAR|nr:hypothetical protein DFH08DRAFT_960607 [Mycena albidolilacea]
MAPTTNNPSTGPPQALIARIDYLQKLLKHLPLSLPLEHEDSPYRFYLDEDHVADTGSVFPEAGGALEILFRTWRMGTVVRFEEGGVRVVALGPFLKRTVNRMSASERVSFEEAWITRLIQAAKDSGATVPSRTSQVRERESGEDEPVDQPPSKKTRTVRETPALPAVAAFPAISLASAPASVPASTPATPPANAPDLPLAFSTPRTELKVALTNTHTPIVLDSNDDMPPSIPIPSTSTVMQTLVPGAIIPSTLHVNLVSNTQATLATMGWQKWLPEAEEAHLKKDAPVLLKRTFFRLHYAMLTGGIPPKLVINADQAGNYLLPASGHTFHDRGAKQVDVVAKDEKRAYTMMLASTPRGDFLPIQAVWAGKIGGSLPNAEAEHHFSTLSTMQEWIRDVIAPWHLHVIASCPDLDDDQLAVFYIDIYSVHIGEEFRTHVFDNYPYIILIFVPGGCTGLFQPADIGLQPAPLPVTPQQN